MSDPTQLSAMETHLAEVVVALFASGTVQQTLQQIVDLSERAVDGCEAAGILRIEDGTMSTLAASSPLVVALDQMQIDSGEGPCVDAANRATTIYVHDLIDDRRWPTFGPLAITAGIRTVLAYSLTTDRASALILYAPLPAAFGPTDRAQASLFAILARVALESAQERAVDARTAGHLTEALRTRARIGQAQGILIERERITAEQAFDVLRRASQHMNIKLREVAATLVETGETPAID
ncbi:MAG TPA: GAF and ANTAR domain-containing protein [Euzebya sp.]|nr:GAF and ANTAR domain-containing protein [Euzebya sp.]